MRLQRLLPGCRWRPVRRGPGRLGRGLVVGGEGRTVAGVGVGIVGPGAQRVAVRILGLRVLLWELWVLKPVLCDC